jgi:hypothetical protein
MRSLAIIQRRPCTVGSSLGSVGLWLLAGVLLLPIGIQAQTSSL